MLGYIFSRLRSSHLGYYSLEQSSYQRALRILDNAKMQSLHLYQESQARAKKIIEEASAFKTDSKEDLDKHISVVTKKQLSEFEGFLQSEIQDFEKAISKEAGQSAKVFADVSKNLQKEVSQGVENLKQTIINETIESQKLIDKKVETEYTQIEAEILKYKKEKLSSIDEKIGDIITNISAEVFAKAFSVADHQELILKILDAEKEKGSLRF
jgi:F0F1-type ATP synthase membrane subunit b/b'